MSNNNIVTISKTKNSNLFDEVYKEWFDCPDCFENGAWDQYISEDFKYCPYCGKKIKWVE